MADGNTIAEQIADIAASKAAIAAAIAAKGVEVPEGAKLADLAALIGNISGGGTSGPDTCELDRDTMTELVIPEGTTKIGNYAFYSCSAINSITIPEGVTSIGNYAFYNCKNLTSLTLPNGLETIGNYAFYGIDPRIAIVIPEGVKTIGDWAFVTTSQYLGTYGGKLYLPSTLESIGYQAFAGFGMFSTTVKCFANGTKEMFKGLLSASGPYTSNIALVVICTDGVFKYEGSDESIVDDDDYVYGECEISKSGNSATFDIQGFGFTWDDTKDDEGFFWTAHTGEEEETKVTQVEILDPGRHVVVTVADMGTSGGAPGRLTFARRTDAGVLETAWTSGFVYH